MKFEKIQINKIKLAKYNPRKDLKPGDPEYDHLKNSIDEFDTVEPLVFNKRTGVLVGGHQRLKILKARGDTEVDVSVVDLDEPHEKALNVALNKIAGEWDNTLLLPLLDEIKLAGIDVELTGFTAADISLMGKKDVEEDDFDAKAAADAIKEPITKPGDIWILGKHRLICSDATDSVAMGRLMDGRKADLLFTDPPYGMDVDTDFKDTFKKTHNPFPNRNLNNYPKVIGDKNQFEFSSFSDIKIKEQFWWGADYYCQQLPTGGSWIIWDKRVTDDLAKGIGNNFEMCWSKQRHKKVIIDYVWAGAVGMKKIDGNRVHPTQKPVGLCGDIISSYSKEEAIILDLFGGSGSTLIACEQLNRICYMCEIDPVYVDVEKARWEKYTGLAAHKLEASQ